MKTGKITKVTSKPRGFVLTTPATVGPPPEPEHDYPYTPVDADDFPVILAAYTKGSDCDVEGESPNCAGVTAK